MDVTLYGKYKEVKLTTELTNMFSDIILKDDATRKVFLHIGQHTTDEEELGITVRQLIERVNVTRRVRKGKFFVVENTNIDRKHAERVVNTLQMMGLCYYRSLAPTKVINLTIRGKQVTAELKKRLINEKGEGKIVQQ